VYALFLFKVFRQNSKFTPISYQCYRAHVEQRMKKNNTVVRLCYFLASILSPESSQKSLCGCSHNGPVLMIATQRDSSWLSHGHNHK
jgi:hypothetical protein